MKVLSLFLLSMTLATLDLDKYHTESEMIEAIKNIDISSIPSSSIERIVAGLNFNAASFLIQRAHDEGTDISVAIRNAVADLRGKLDHLVKLLDPEYFRPQKVPPAFQWTQNDTAVFIQLKYSRRFNAPGSVDVEDFNCSFTNSSLLFSAIGGHSGKRFEYALNLDFFDEIVPDLSSWNIGSVGKVLLTIMKRSPSKWPRLLLTTIKTDNMHHWYDFGEKMETSLKGLPIIAESPLTCSSTAKVYCPTSGKCAADCSDCKSKPTVEEGACVGSPAYKPKDISFTDTDDEVVFVKGSVGVTIVKEYHRYDVDGFNIYIVSSGTALTEDSRPVSVSGPISNVTAQADLPRSHILSPSELVAVPFNSRGENREKQFRKSMTDLFRPENCSSVNPVSFEDLDGDEGKLKGVLRFSPPADTNNATNLVIHWGKSESEKHFASQIAEMGISTRMHNITTSQVIPQGATHILIFAKSPVGEGSRPVGFCAIQDRKLPKALVTDLRLLADRRIEFKRIETESKITGYTIRTEWTSKNGRSESEDIETVATAGMFSFSNMAKSSKSFQQPPSEDLKNGSWKICVYVSNEVGVAKQGSCVNIEIPTDPRTEL
jgi:hypothetical protein